MAVRAIAAGAPKALRRATPELWRRRAAPAAFVRARRSNAMFVGLAVAHGAILMTTASFAVVAIGLWWNANTIAHNFIHRPFFRSRAANRLFSSLLSLVLGIPQSYWRDRHLAHHAGRDGDVRIRAAVVVETALILGMWMAMIAAAPAWLVRVYAPGYAIGLVLCWLQGHYEHAGGTTSHYGWLYNTLFFNDGYHVEHHRRPGLHWTELPSESTHSDRQSPWPAVLRWLDEFSTAVLEQLEKIVLRSPALQRFVLSRHERALRPLVSQLRDIRRVTIVGGGLFPRTAVILFKLLPDAVFTIVDANARHLEIARSRIRRPVSLVHAEYDPRAAAADQDLVVIPLAFRGDRHALYRQPPAPAVIVHDWIWRPRGLTSVVSWLLAKRVNLVQP